MKRLTHLASDGSARMVDVSAKPVSHREAVAQWKDRITSSHAEIDRLRSHCERKRLRHRPDRRNPGCEADGYADSALS